MDNTKAHLLNTQLKDRTLWYDGDSSFNPHFLLEAVRKYNVVYVDAITDAVKEYNRVAPKDQELRIKTACKPLKFDWQIPVEYQNLDITSYILDKHDILIKGMKPHEISARDIRLSEEILRYHESGLFDVLRTIIYIINTLTSNNIVWGVGRGSSVSSYVLYVLGVHDVDSYAYGLDINDFLHE